MEGVEEPASEGALAQVPGGVDSSWNT